MWFWRPLPRGACGPDQHEGRNPTKWGRARTRPRPRPQTSEHRWQARLDFL